MIPFDKSLKALQQDVRRLKGSLSFTYDYHSSSWVACRSYKGDAFVNTYTDEGEGQYSLEAAAAELIHRMKLVLGE